MIIILYRTTELAFSSNVSDNKNTLISTGMPHCRYCSALCRCQTGVWCSLCIWGCKPSDSACPQKWFSSQKSSFRASEISVKKCKWYCIWFWRSNTASPPLSFAEILFTNALTWYCFSSYDILLCGHVFFINATSKPLPHFVLWLAEPGVSFLKDATREGEKTVSSYQLTFLLCGWRDELFARGPFYI